MRPSPAFATFEVMGSGGGAPTAKWPAAVPEADDGEPLDPRRAEARLLVRRPDVPEVEIPIERNEFLIGRLAAEADLVLDDDLVSRRHARLTMDSRGYFRLEDLGSKNGITYEGRMVRRLNLLDGDVFKIGKTELTFHAKIERYQQPEQKPAPPPRADSVMADVDVPAPKATPEPEENEPIGWDPEAMKRPAPEPEPQPEAPEGGQDEEPA